MTLRRLLILLIGFITACGTSAHYRNILIDRNSMGYGPCEPSIAMDPNNINNLVAAAVLGSR